MTAIKFFAWLSVLLSPMYPALLAIGIAMLLVCAIASKEEREQ